MDISVIFYKWMDSISDWISLYLNKKTVIKLKIVNLNNIILIINAYITNVCAGFWIMINRF